MLLLAGENTIHITGRKCYINKICIAPFPGYKEAFAVFVAFNHGLGLRVDAVTAGKLVHLLR